MHAIFRFGPVDSTTFAAQADAALRALRATAGCRSALLLRGVDDPDQWVLIAEWDGVGAYRRALSSYDVRVNAYPLLVQARDEASAFLEPGVDGHAGDALV